MANIQFDLALLYAMTIRESAADGSDFTPPAADYRRLFLGEDGRLYLMDSTGDVETVVGSGTGVTPGGYSYSDECFLRIADTSSYAGGLDDNFSGTGATVSETSDANHPGVLAIATGTATNGRSRVGSVSQTGLTLGGGVYRLSCVAKLVTLSDGTNTYTVRLGLGAAVTGDSPEAVYFRYGSALNGGEWQGVCRTGAVETALDTNVAADTNWHLFEFEVNAAGTSVEFFIDGVSVGTVASNIPLGAMPGPNFMILKSAGTTSRTLQLDYYAVVHELTTPRG